MDQPAYASELQEAQEREKHLRFEKVAEKSTYLVIFGGLLLTFLPLSFPIQRGSLYILFTLALLVAFFWFRLLPQSFISPLKSFHYFLFSVSFIYLGVHFTNGIQSFVVFIFYLSVLRAAAFINLVGFVAIVLLITTLLLIEAYFFNTYLSLDQRLSLWALHAWALAVIAIFGRYIFDKEQKAESLEESAKLKTAKQIDAVKNEFVFLISKKLKKPLLLLESYLATALKSVDQNWSKELSDFLSKASENSQRLANLVNDLSALSSVESQKLSLEKKPVDLNQVVGSTLSDFNMRAAEKNITLSYQPTGDKVLVLADQSRLHEILANLVDNAIKYSPNSAVIQVSFGHDGKIAQVNIKDNGLGIPDEAKNHLFEKFYRVNRSNSEPKGTGLGLFVTKELVERQGGKVWFEGKVNEGTNFHFTLP